MVCFGLLLALGVALVLHGLFTNRRDRARLDDIPTLDMRPTPPERPSKKKEQP